MRISAVAGGPTSTFGTPHPRTPINSLPLRFIVFGSNLLPRVLVGTTMILSPFLKWLSSLLLDWLLGRLGIRIDVLLGRTILGPVAWLSTVETVTLVGGTTSARRSLLLKKCICLSCNPRVSSGNHVSKV